jgi:LacI family transcriptional regulator
MPLRSRKKQKSVLLALGWYVHEINVGVARYAREAEWILDDTSSHSGVLPSGWAGDGIIALLESESSPLMDFVKSTRLPVVDLSGQLPQLQLPRVLPDNEGIGRIAAEELLSRGFRHFAFFTMDREAPVVVERMTGFRVAAEKAGAAFHLIDFTPEVVRTKDTAGLVPWLAKRLKKLPKPLAAMAQYDAEANYIVRACLQGGMQVPDEVAVVGVDNDPIYSELGPIPLTSVVSNRELAGYRGAELLDSLMRGGRAPKEPIRIPPGGIVVRRSSDIFATEDPALSKALAYIQAHAAAPIQVDDIVTASGASRRALYLKFAKHIGRSIHSEIVRQRLNLAKQMLSSSDVKLEEIAADCGFDGAASLSKVFKSYEGMPPSAYREKHQRAGS